MEEARGPELSDGGWRQRTRAFGVGTSRRPGSQDSEMDCTACWEGVEGFKQKNEMTSQMQFTSGEWSAGRAGIEQRRQRLLRNFKPGWW